MTVRCGPCGRRKIWEGRATTTKSFIAKAKAVHGEKYDYSKSIYTGTHEKLTIICPEHGAFEQAPTNHIDSKQGCMTCGLEANAKKQTMTTEYFIERAQKIHGQKYDYSKSNYAGSGTKITIICPEHGEYEQVPESHYAGSGCPNCSITGFAKMLRDGCDKANA